MATFDTIDDYIDSFPDDVRAVLQDVRRTIRDVVPEAAEKISYGIPTFTLDGKYLVYFAGWQNHVSVYPVPVAEESLQRDLAPYLAGKGTLRFPLDQPIPHDLIARVVRLLVEERTNRRS